MHYLVHVLLLALFWLALSGHFSPLMLALGAVSVVLVVGLRIRMDHVDGEDLFLRPTPLLLLYAVWLLWAVVRANIDVARRIWDPALPIRPAWRRLDTRLTTPMERTLYANSITLTPGTLTTDVRDDHYLIHCLSDTDLDELREGTMERHIRRLGI